jgi:excisionase family DNA binding protein
MLAGVIRPPLHQIRWLSLAEATALTGLPRDFLRGAVETGQLPALTSGQRTLIKWTDLETFHPQGEMPKAKPNAALRNGLVSQPQIADNSPSN